MDGLLCGLSRGKDLFVSQWIRLIVRSGVEECAGSTNIKSVVSPAQKE